MVHTIVSQLEDGQEFNCIYGYASLCLPALCDALYVSTPVLQGSRFIFLRLLIKEESVFVGAEAVFV
jgi:hypothetical protein